MAPLRRHQLAHVSTAGWHRLLAAPWDDEARDCIGHWARHQLPLVVTRQPPGTAEGEVALGLAAPAHWQRRRLACRLPLRELMYLTDFPMADRLPSLRRALHARWSALCYGLAEAGTVARVYGSHGWQMLTRLDHLRPGSDIDLWITVSDERQADAAAALLQSFGHEAGTPRLDGEIGFGCGAAVAWREWAAWRAGRTPSILVKRLHGAAIEQAAFWHGAAPAAPWPAMAA